jgi:hypothetical protein
MALKRHTMKLTYDRDRNDAYLRLRPKGGEVETIRVSAHKSPARPLAGSRAAPTSI